MNLTSYLPQLRGLENALVFSAPMIIFLSSIAIYNRQLDATTQEQRWRRAVQEQGPLAHSIHRSHLPAYPLDPNWIICNFGVTYFLIILVISEAMARGLHGDELMLLQVEAGFLVAFHCFIVGALHLGFAADAWRAAMDKLSALNQQAVKDASTSVAEAPKADVK